jgi:GTP cyclohydrolase I
MTTTVPFVSRGAAISNGDSNAQLHPDLASKIRERLRKADVPFLANDNISDHLEPGELSLLEIEVADKVRDLLRTLVIDIDNDHNTSETAERVARMYLHEVFKRAVSPSAQSSQLPQCEAAG